MRKFEWTFVVMIGTVIGGMLFAQAPTEPPRVAPEGDLKVEAAKPTFYSFELGKKILVHERAAAVDFGGVVFSPLEAREIEFTFDEKDNHLTAKITCAVVRVLDAVRTVHVALYDERQRLLGTASASTTIRKFVVNNMPASEQVELALDFGESATYKACKSFQVCISGRGRSTAKFDSKDADELFRRLGQGRSPEAQYDAAVALAALGDSVLLRLKSLAQQEDRVGRLSLEAIRRIGSPAAVAVLDEQLRSTEITDARRIELYDLLSTMGPAAYQSLSEELERTSEERLLVPLVRALAVLQDPRVGPLLTRCLQDEKRYFGRVRAEIAVALMKCGEKAAVPALIAALRDPSGPVRMAAAYAVEELTHNSIPLEWDGPADTAWMNAPPAARELAAKQWEEWWKANSAKFGVR